MVNEALAKSEIPLYIFVENGKQFDFLQNEKIITLTKSMILTLCDVSNHSGIVGVFQIKKKIPQKPCGNFLVLENVQDPGNVGTLIRSAQGANFLDIYLINCATITNPKTYRSSMGAVFSTNCCELNFSEFETIFKTWNLPLFCADMSGENIYKCKLPCCIGIVIGNEGNGVGKNMETLCTGKIKIPMANGLESLNAGVSGSILMFEIAFGGKNVRSQ